MLLSERTHSENATYCMNPIIWHFRKGKTIMTVKRSVVAWSLVEGEGNWIDEAQGNFRAVKLFSLTQ